MRLSLINILNERGEITAGFPDLKYDRTRIEGYQISQIFYGRHIKSGQIASIKSISSSNDEAMLRLMLQESDPPDNKVATQTPIFQIERDADLLVFESNVRERIPITEDGVLLNTRFKTTYKDKSRFLTTNYKGFDELAVLWDNITLTPKEDKVVEALQILEPTVDRISFTSSQTSNSGILLRLRGEDDPIPLGSMGDGMRRIMAIAASLVSVEQGTLLVDEIDTGLYYGALMDMWRLVLETASKQNAQVFATTHSWDCVKAFQQALDNFQEPSIGKLVRLEKSENKVKAIHYSADELDIAIAQGIEVR